MDLYSRLRPSSQLSEDYTLHLIEINNDILKVLNSSDVSNDDNEKNKNKNDKKRFLIKSETNTSAPYFVTEDATYLIRQKNHSNCMMLLDSKPQFQPSLTTTSDAEKDNTNRSIGLSLFDSQLELTKVEPRINIGDIPILSTLDQLKETPANPRSLKQVFENSNVPEAIFKSRYHNLKLTEIQDITYIVSDGLIMEVMYILISLVISQGSSHESDGSSRSSTSASSPSSDVMEYFNYLQKDQLIKSMLVENPQYPSEVIEMIILKYTTIVSDDAGDRRRLKHDEVITLFGTQLLIKYSSRNFINEDEFILNLKSDLPFYYNPDINIDKSLSGKFIRSLNDPLKIQYFDPEYLSQDPATRLNELFKIKSSWDLIELEPFIKEINPKGMKSEKFLMKFARVRKQGKTTLVTSR